MFGLVAVAGFLARIVQYAQRRPLFVDDIQLMLNIATRGYGRLLRPLALEQSASPLFLWVQRFIVQTLGVSDVAFTLISLATGLAVLPLTWSVARRIVDRETSMLAEAILAVAPPLIYYSTSAKQYGTDVFVAAAVCWLGLRVLEAPTDPRRRLLAVAGGVVALMLSMPALFVLGGVWCAWALSEPIRASRQGRTLLVASGALWGVTFASLFRGMYAEVSKNAYMRRFWFGSYLSSQRTLLGGIRYVAKGLHAPLYDVGSRTPWLLVYALSFLTLAGVVALVREKRVAFAALLTVPLLLAVAASALGQWILTPRFMLYAAPLVCVLVAHGDAAIARGITASRRYREALLVAGGLAVIALPARYATWVMVHPTNTEASPELISGFRAHAGAGEPVYVYARALPLWTYYSTDWKRPDTVRVQRLLRSMSEIGPGSGNGQSRGRPVRHEGFERRYPFGSSVELAGIATGMEHTGAVQAHAPDFGWAENEATRIHDAASPTAWIAFAHYNKVPLRELQSALERLGGRVTFSDVRPGAALFQYRFAAPDSAVARRPTDPSVAVTAGTVPARR